MLRTLCQTNRIPIAIHNHTLLKFCDFTSKATQLKNESPTFCLDHFYWNNSDLLWKFGGWSHSCGQQQWASDPTYLSSYSSYNPLQSLLCSLHNLPGNSISFHTILVFFTVKIPNPPPLLSVYSASAWHPLHAEDYQRAFLSSLPDLLFLKHLSLEIRDVLWSKVRGAVELKWDLRCWSPQRPIPHLACYFGRF